MNYTIKVTVAKYDQVIIEMFVQHLMFNSNYLIVFFSSAFALTGEILTGDSDGNVMVWKGIKVVRVLKGAHQVCSFLTTVKMQNLTVMPKKTNLKKQYFSGS